MALTPPMIEAATQAFQDETAFAVVAQKGAGVNWSLKFIAGGITLFDGTAPYPGGGVDPWSDDFELWKTQVQLTGQVLDPADKAAVDAARARIGEIKVRIRQIRQAFIDGNGTDQLAFERVSLQEERERLRREIKDRRGRPRFAERGKPPTAAKRNGSAKKAVKTAVKPAKKQVKRKPRARKPRTKKE